MKIKAILSDLDGTLIDFDGKYHEDVPSLIKKIQMKNIHFSLATGRSRVGKVDKVIQELNLSPLHVLCGGGMIFNWKTGEVPLHRTISQQSVQKIEHYFEQKHVLFCLETHNEVHMIDPKMVPEFMKGTEVKKYTKEAIPQKVLKILLFAAANKKKESEIEKYIDDISKFCEDVELVKFRSEVFYGLDITSKGSTKYTAVLAYANMLNISASEMIAIGDGHNDFSLFAACGYKIAMGNAPQELKELANKVVGTSANGGMKEALEHILSMV